MIEKRAEVRQLCSDLIEVRVDGDEPRELIANLEDISPSGACLQFEELVARGARVTLRLGHYKFRGQIRYCILTGLGYFAGVQFEAGRKWSRELYEPKHLLDPTKLPARKRRPC